MVTCSTRRRSERLRISSPRYAPIASTAHASSNRTARPEHRKGSTAPRLYARAPEALVRLRLHGHHGVSPVSRRNASTIRCRNRRNRPGPQREHHVPGPRLGRDKRREQIQRPDYAHRCRRHAVDRCGNRPRPSPPQWAPRPHRRRLRAARCQPRPAPVPNRFSRRIVRLYRCGWNTTWTRAGARNLTASSTASISGWMVAVVVDHRDAANLSVRLEAPLGAAEARQRFGGRAGRHVEMRADRDRGQRVPQVVKLPGTARRMGIAASSPPAIRTLDVEPNASSAGVVDADCRRCALGAVGQDIDPTLLGAGPARAASRRRNTGSSAQATMRPPAGTCVTKRTNASSRSAIPRTRPDALRQGSSGPPLRRQPEKRTVALVSLHHHERPVPHTHAAVERPQPYRR